MSDKYKKTSQECTIFIIKQLREKKINDNSAISIINDIAAGALATVIFKVADKNLTSWNEVISMFLERLSEKLHSVKLDVTGISKCNMLEIKEVNIHE